MAETKKTTLPLDSLKHKDEPAKLTTAPTLRVPAVNNHGGFGRWAFIEIADPWNAQRTIRTSPEETQ